MPTSIPRRSDVEDLLINKGSELLPRRGPYLRLSRLFSHIGINQEGEQEMYRRHINLQRVYKGIMTETGIPIRPTTISWRIPHERRTIRRYQKMFRIQIDSDQYPDPNTRLKAWRQDHPTWVINNRHRGEDQENIDGILDLRTEDRFWLNHVLGECIGPGSWGHVAMNEALQILMLDLSREEAIRLIQDSNIVSLQRRRGIG